MDLIFSIFDDACDINDLETINSIIDINFGRCSIQQQEKYITALCKLQNPNNIIKKFLDQRLCEPIIQCTNHKAKHIIIDSRSIKWVVVPCCNRNKYMILYRVAAQTGHMFLIDLAISNECVLDLNIRDIIHGPIHPDVLCWLHGHYRGGRYDFYFNHEERMMLLYHNRHVLWSDEERSINDMMRKYKRHKIAHIISTLIITDWDYKNLTDIVCDYVDP